MIENLLKSIFKRVVTIPDVNEFGILHFKEIK